MTIHRIRLSKMQKVINVLAVASFALSGAIAASGVYVYVNRDSIIDGIKSQVLGGFGAGALGGGNLPIGAPDLASPTQPQASAPSAPSPELPTF